ncbi:MAG: HEAT repeat domain-containing protein [bacterium]
MEKIKSVKFDAYLDNFIRNYSITGNFNPREFQELLSKATLSEDRDLRRVACKIIRRLRLKNLLPYIRILLNDEDPVVRSLSLLAIAQFKDQMSYSKVVEAYNCDNKMVRASSILALGSLDRQEGYELIYKSLNDTSEEIRENAVIALSWINNPKSIQTLLELYEKEESKNIKNRIIKAFMINSSNEINKKLEDIIFKENDETLILTAINSLLRKGVTKYNILANTILYRNIDQNLKNSKYVEGDRKHLYSIVSHNIWELKSINPQEQKQIFKFLEEDLVNKYYFRSEEIRKISISSLKNLDSDYHQIIIKLLQTTLSTYLKIEVINFLASHKVDKNLKFLLLEFLFDTDRMVREQVLFAVMDSVALRSIVSYVNDKLFSLDYGYLKLIALAVVYNTYSTY